MSDKLEGKTVSEVVEMEDEEVSEEFLHSDNFGNPYKIVFEDGTVIFPSADEEGNTPGCIYINGEFVQRVDLDSLEGDTIDFCVPGEEDIPVLVTNNENVIRFYRDPERNGPGVIFGISPDVGKCYYFLNS